MRSVNPLVQGRSARSGGKKCAEQGKRDLELFRLVVKHQPLTATWLDPDKQQQFLVGTSFSCNPVSVTLNIFKTPLPNYASLEALCSGYTGEVCSLIAALCVLVGFDCSVTRERPGIQLRFGMNTAPCQAT